MQVDSRDLDRRKTLQMTNTVKTIADNDEFEKQRTAAIAEVAKSKEVRKHVYGILLTVNYDNSMMIIPHVFCVILSISLLNGKCFLMFACL